jgi:regulator of sirC expression with transglutaminase-like and TPR domain
VTTRGEAEAALTALAKLPDEEIDLAEAALAISMLRAHTLDPAPYRQHLSEIAVAVGHATGSAFESRIDALNHVILGTFGYEGDALNYDDLDNADLARVIDRRKGLPVSLGILYLHAARAQGWSAAGLGFPGHFLIRIEGDGVAAVVDPFHAGRVLNAAGLRELLKATCGLDAELEPAHWQAVSNRDVLIRLQNNIKARCLESGDVARALQAVEAMLLFAPDVAHLWREAGVLNLKLDQLGAAIRALERYVELSGRGPARDEAERLLNQVRAGLN